MKKIIFSLLSFICITVTASAQTAFTIDASEMQSDASYSVVAYAVNEELELVGTTAPFSVPSAGIYTFTDAQIAWEGSAPSGDWGWGYVLVTLSCSGPSNGSTNSCSSTNYDGAMIGHVLHPNASCFEMTTNACGAQIGETLEVEMGNDGHEKPSYPSGIKMK